MVNISGNVGTTKIHVAMMEVVPLSNLLVCCCKFNEMQDVSKDKSRTQNFSFAPCVAVRHI